jgi:hypothetical protein
MTTVITWILSLCAFCYILTRSTGIDRRQKLDIDFDDYKEKELGDMGIFKDEAEFNDYKEF